MHRPEVTVTIPGLVIVTTTARKGFLIPRDTWDFPPRHAWQPEWIGQLEGKGDENPGLAPVPLWKAWLPYDLLALLLVIIRLPDLPVGAALRNALELAWEDMLGTGIRASTTPLYLPGTILIGVVLLTIPIHRMHWQQVRLAIADSGKVLFGAGFVLIFTVPMVRVYINSGINALSLPNMPIAIAEWAAASIGASWPLFAPTIGALGAFIAGSNTISNLMFSLFQHSVAQRLHISGVLIMACRLSVPLLET